MPLQKLISIINVTLNAGDEIDIDTGIQESGAPRAPTFVIPDQDTSIVVVGNPIQDTPTSSIVRFRNNNQEELSQQAKFWCERVHTLSGLDTSTGFYWRGNNR